MLKRYSGFGLAIDIGTTTIVLSLFNLLSGKIIAAISSRNKQQKYGIDIISRITYTLSHKNNHKKIQKILIDTIKEMIEKLKQEYKINSNDIYKVTISSNAVMNHTFMGYSLKKFSRFPFNAPIQNFGCIKNSHLNLNINKKGLIYIIPNIASFIGGDIVSDIYSASLNNKKIELLIDIGTNGEIVLNNKGKLFCTSTAAGPAFEGGKIKFGMGAQKGAIYAAKIKKDKKIEIKTFGGENPVGICGTGLIDAISLFRKLSVISTDGRINSVSDYTFKTNNHLVINLYKRKIYITQKDIREFQLAKGAIKAGISLLLKENNIKENDIDKVYISGAFGNYLNIKNTLRLNFLPLLKVEKYKFIGNGSLTGAQHALLNKNVLKEMETLSKNITFVEIATKPQFQDIFIDSLSL